MERNEAKRLSWKAGLVAGVFLLSPALAVAQQAPALYATATLYEVREDINCNPGGSTNPACLDDANGFGVRIADATLNGSFDGPGNFAGAATIEATSILNQRDWTGPAHGKITLDSGVHATFAGQLSLAAAMFTRFPIAPISGKWQGTKGTLHAGGDFVGTFYVPFVCAVVEEKPVYCYLRLDANGNPVVNPDGTPAVDVAPGPIAKLMAMFYNN